MPLVLCHWKFNGRSGRRIRDTFLGYRLVNTDTVHTTPYHSSRVTEWSHLESAALLLCPPPLLSPRPERLSVGLLRVSSRRLASHTVRETLAARVEHPEFEPPSDRRTADPARYAGRPSAAPEPLPRPGVTQIQTDPASSAHTGLCRPVLTGIRVSPG